MASLWEQTWEEPGFPALEGDLSTDVLIIGGGMAGVLCAYFLHHAGVPYVLVEAKTLCSGITRNTTAKITSQHGLIYDKLIRKFGVDRARQYLSAQEAALQKYRELCQTVDCGFEEKDAYVYSMDDRQKIEQELNALEKLGFPGEFSGQLPLPFPVAGAVKFPRQAQFHPLKFVSAITEGLHIYEHTTVRELAGTTASTDRGKIRAKKIIVTTHFPFLNKHGSYFLKLYQQRSYVLALENAPALRGMYLDERENGLSFREYDGRLILGGGGHRTGHEGGGWNALEQFAKTHYPDARITHRWAAQDCMSLDGVPYIGRYSAMTLNLYVASGFNKWGMTTSMVAAQLLTDIITGKKSPYEAVFSPSRSMLHAQLGVNAVEAGKNLLTVSPRRCSHLGCALKWNPQERSWDCPCHGSRFEENGRLIDNPATKNLRSH